jgi:hypothetical protein
MCEYFSCLITREGLVVWNDRTNSHDELVKTANLKDEKLEDRDFVRIEITPKDKKKITRDKNDWELKVDEEGTLPKWYTEKQTENEKKCFDAWAISVKTQVLINAETADITDKYVLCAGKSRVALHGKSSAKLCDNSSAELCGNSSADLWGNSSAELYGNSSANLSGNSSAKLYGNSSAKLYDNSRVIKYSESAKVKLERDTASYIFEGKIYVRNKKNVEKQGVI